MSKAALARYTFRRRIGTGGMGDVWEAVHEDRPNTPVAVKIRHEVTDDRDGRRRLLAEAKIIANLQHENVVRLLEIVEDKRGLLLVMELLDGYTLHALQRLGPLPPGLVVSLALQALAGLSHVHNAMLEGAPARLVHRDIKPSNLFVTKEGQLKLIDFGVAIGEGLDLTKTRTGVLKGTFSYVSPEVARGEELDLRTDLFSLGVVIYELLSGQRVYKRPTEAATLSAVLFETIRPLRFEVAGLTPALESAVAWALQKDRNARPASAEVWADALRDAVTPEEIWGPEKIAPWLAQHALELKVESTSSGSLIDVPDLPTSMDVAAPTAFHEAERAQPGHGRRWAIAGAAALAAAAVVALALRSKPSPTVAVTPSPVAVAPVAVAPAPTPAATIPSPSPTQSHSPGPKPAVKPVATSAPRPERHRPPVHRAVPAPVPSAPAEDGWLTIDSKPNWSWISLDGKKLGASPVFRQRVSAGPHAIVATQESGSTQKKKVVVKGGQEERIVVTWP